MKIELLAAILFEGELARCVVIDAGDEAVAEELALVASHAEVVLDVTGGLFQVERFEVVADGDALVEGPVRGGAKRSLWARNWKGV